MLPSITGRPSKRASSEAKNSVTSLRLVFSGDDGVVLVSENVVSELPCDFDDGKIIHMGRHSIPSQTGDLFSVGRSSPEQQISEPEAAPLPRRVALPKDLPAAMRYLDDRQLDLLLQAAIDEAAKTRKVACESRRRSHIDGRRFATKKGFPGQADSLSEHQKCCGVNSGAGERCARRLQGWDHANENCPPVRPLSGGCSPGPFI